MKTSFKTNRVAFLRKPTMKRSPKLVAALAAGFSAGMYAIPNPASADNTPILQTNLVTDDQSYVPAQVQDTNLVNPWGLAAGPTGEWWVANMGTGTSTLYNTSSATVSVDPLVVANPLNSSSDFAALGSSPTGVVYHDPSAGGFQVSGNGTTGSSVFLFDALDGTISGWSPQTGSQAIIGPTTSNNHALYTGLAIAKDTSSVTRLYAADFFNTTTSSGGIDVYDQNFNRVTLAGSFTDPSLPAGYTPFNVQAINNLLYVEYAPAGNVLNGVMPQKGDGAVVVYNPDGTLNNQLIAPGDANLVDPWAVAMAPSNFGSFSNDLLVGNFGDGTINAFDPTTGQFIGELKDANGDPIDIPHLWALAFGNDDTAGPANTLYFTAGLSSHLAAGPDPFHGLFGSLEVPEPASVALLGVLGLSVLMRRRRRDNHAAIERSAEL